MIRFLTLALLLASPAAAEEITTDRYRCDRGAQVLASYLNLGERSLAVLTFEGRQMVFEVADSASGARYVSHDPTAPFVWWTKGDTAILLHGAGDAEVMIYSECQAG